MLSKIILFIGALVVVVAGLLGVAFYSQKSTPPETASSTPITVNNGPGYTIEKVAITEGITPDIHRPVQYAASIPQNIRDMIQKKVDINVASLAKDNTNPGAWLDLALWYKTADDYDGARIIWEFMTKAAPQDPTSFDNLGKMYHFDTPNFVKAEQYFKQSMTIAPESMNAYLELFELYSLSYKQNTTAAVDILNTAIQKFPQQAALSFTLGSYYRERGNMTLARSALEKALDIARTQNDLSLMAQINAALAELP